MSSNPMNRRQLLSLGSAGVLSALFSQLGSRVASADDAAAAPAPPSPLGLATHCIVLWMNGGPSHIDTFDPKPGTAAGGAHKAIATRAPGVSICEHMPRIAERMDKIALLRGVTSKEGNHQRAQELGHTGHVPNPTVRAPSLGAWVAKERPRAGLAIPSFVSLGGPSAGGGFFGNPYDPFVIQEPGGLPDDLAPARPVSANRERSRRALLDSFEADFAKASGDPKVEARRALYGKARSLMASPSVRAFEIAEETEETKKSYGDSDFGRGCLVARRLVESGVPFVEVTLDGWDTHQNNFERTQGRMEILDPAMSALIADLDARGLLARTVIACMGEFGRSPRINGDEGRDHHPAAFSVALAGAGIRGGVAFGETDAEGGAVVKDPVSVPDVLATLAHTLGIDPLTEAVTPRGRPITITERGRPIRAILR